MAQVRKSHISQRYADKGARQKGGMGNAKSRFIDDGSAVQKQVDVDGSRGLGRAHGTHPPLGALDVQARMQKCARRKFGFKPHRRVQIGRLIRAALG